MIECTLYYLVKDNINKVLTLSLTPATGTIGTEYFCASSFTTFITHSAWATFFLYSSHLKLSSHRESGLHLLFWLKLLILPHLVWMPWSLGCVIVISAAIFSPIHLRVLTLNLLISGYWRVQPVIQVLVLCSVLLASRNQWECISSW